MRTAFVLAILLAISAVPVWALTAEELAKLLPADAADNDRFGGSVALDGDTAIIGAPGDHSDPGTYVGSAYVFSHVAGAWIQEAKLLPTAGHAADLFGQSVAIDGDTVVVGAHGDDQLWEDSGAAYVFTRNGGVWTQQVKLLPVGGDSSDFFGCSVAIDGDEVMIGAYGRGGAAYIFTRVGGIWSQEARLVAWDSHVLEHFGRGVAIDGNTAFVGAERDSDHGTWAGAAYVFTRSENVWTPMSKLIPPDVGPYDFFGEHLALDDSTAVVGVPMDDGNAMYEGSAYVFTREAGVWTLQARLLAADGALGEGFGNSVAIHGDTVLIGAEQEDDNDHIGAAYLFTRSESDWTEQIKLRPTDGESGDWFGSSVALDGDRVLVGAIGDDDAGPGVGSAYVFRMLPCGDGVLDPGEECDDGNNMDGDGCAADCTIEVDVPATTVVGLAVLLTAVLGGGVCFVRRRPRPARGRS